MANIESVLITNGIYGEEAQMEKFIPYEKLSKKEQRKISAVRRNTWGAVSPVTRKPENSRAYNRRKARKCVSMYV